MTEPETQPEHGLRDYLALTVGNTLLVLLFQLLWCPTAANYRLVMLIIFTEGVKLEEGGTPDWLIRFHVLCDKYFEVCQNIHTF